MGRITRWRLLAVVLAVVLVAGACGSNNDSVESGGDGTAGTIRVPDDFDTIQEAVDEAEPGSLILIEPGTYNEAVNVTTDDLVIRGLDRNEVVLDGEFELENGVRVLEANGVVVENMTAQNYTGNGFFWTGVDGYRGSYLTAIRNGDYGIYAYGSVNGVLEHSYGGGSPDAGVYIGQCGDCNAVIDDVVSEWNGLGYSGTNSTNVTIVNSVFRLNRAGVVPNAGSYEGCAPPVENTIVGNLVHDNGNTETAAIDAAISGEGNGILLAGTNDTVVERNRVLRNPVAGIAIVPLPEFDAIGPLIETPDPECTEDAVPVSEEEQAELPDPLVWHSNRNRVVDNLVSDSGGWDLALIEDPDKQNCFSGNEVTETSPPRLQEVSPCDGEIGEFSPQTVDFLALLDAESPPSADYEEVDLPDPGDLETMPDPEESPAEPARGPGEVDVAAIELPEPPTDE